MTGVTQPIAGVVYPPRETLQRYVEAGALTDETWVAALQRSFKENGARIAVDGPEGALTYAQLDGLTDRAGAALLASGLRPLDRVVFQLGNSKELLIAFIGCLKAGLIPICTLAAHREQEIGYLARHAKARGHLVQGDDKFDLVGFGQEMQRSVPSLDVLISARGPARADVPRLEDLLEQELRSKAIARLQDVPRDPFQAALFQLSGGTTGVPKLIPRFQNEYLHTMREVARYLDYRRDDVMFMPLPMIHNASMACAWGPTLLQGGTFVVVPQLTEQAIVQVLKQCKPTWIGAGVKQAVLKLKAAMDAAQVEPGRVRGVWTINAAKYTREVLDLPGCHTFGMSEGFLMFTRDSDSREAREETVGKPMSGLDEVRLLKPGTEMDVAPGEIGELAVRGPSVIHGYFDAEERNRQAFTRDGFYRSGDLMSARVIDGAKYYAFEGRIKDVIDRGGEKVNCEEIELALGEAQGIAEAALVGMPDPGLGERICAFVTLRPGCSPSEVGVPSFARFLEKRGFAKFKWPERVEVLSAMPTTKFGKIDKAELRRLASTPALSGVHHTARPTWKLRETVEFYRDRLGLKLVHAISAKGWGPEGHPDFLHFFFDSGDGSTIAFFYYIGAAQPEYLVHRPQWDCDSVHTAWKVRSEEELLRWKRFLEGAGVAVDMHIRHEIVESIYFRDPNGYLIEIGRATRATSVLDHRDAELTLAAAMEAETEARSGGQTFTSIETVWQRKARLHEELKA